MQLLGLSSVSLSYPFFLYYSMETEPHPRDLITQTRYWYIFLDPDQKNLGTCIVSLKRESGHLSSLKPAEWQEFIKIVYQLEKSIKKAFKATLFNWGCFLSEIEENKLLHLEWHVIPRYQQKLEFEKKSFSDPCFGKSTIQICGETLILPYSLRNKIISKIRENLNI